LSITNKGTWTASKTLGTVTKDGVRPYYLRRYPLDGPELLRRLHAAYGPQRWWPAKSRFEMIVGAYLTQNTAWRNAALAIANLRRAGKLTASAFRQTALPELERLLRPSGFYRQKAANLKAFVHYLYAQHAGSLHKLLHLPTDRLRTELLQLPGVGPETADCILLYAAQKPVFIVDVYARRVFSRHGMMETNATYAEIQAVIEKQFNANNATRIQDFNEFHALLVEVGKRHCGTQARCEGCPLESCLPIPTGRKK